MFEQDFIMRQIKQFIEVLDRILNKKKEGKYDDALISINQALKDLTDEDDMNFNDLTFEKTISILQNDKIFNAELAVIISDLLYEKAELLGNTDEKKKCLMQSYILNKKSLENSNLAFPIESFEKMEKIEDFLSQEEMNVIKQALK